MNRPSPAAPFTTGFTKGLLWLFLAAGGIPADAETAATPAEVLSREFGLLRRGKSEVWITPREMMLRRQLDQLPPLVERTRAHRDWIAESQARNLLLWPQRQAREKVLKKELGKLSSGDVKRKPLEEELKSLDRLAVAPEKLGGAPWVQPRLMDLSSGLNAILLGVFSVRRHAASLADEYQSLAQDQEVSDALKQLGGGHRLGPLRDYSADLRRLEEFEQFVFSQATPLYLQSGHLRVGAILDERMPITFTWQENGEVVITAGMGQAAGIVAEAGAAERMIRCGGNRRLPAKRVVLKSLRFGKHVLEDMEAWLLPPEGEDAGCRIGAAAFPGFQVAAEPSQLRFRIEPSK